MRIGAGMRQADNATKWIWIVGQDFDRFCHADQIVIQYHLQSQKSKCTGPKFRSLSGKILVYDVYIYWRISVIRFWYSLSNLRAESLLSEERKEKYSW